MHIRSELAGLAPRPAPDLPARLVRRRRTKTAITTTVGVIFVALAATAALVLPDALRLGYFEQGMLPASVVAERCPNAKTPVDTPRGEHVGTSAGQCNVGFDMKPSPVSSVDGDPLTLCAPATGNSQVRYMRLLSQDTLPPAVPGTAAQLVAFIKSRNDVLLLCSVSKYASGIWPYETHEDPNVLLLSDPANRKLRSVVVVGVLHADDKVDTRSRTLRVNIPGMEPITFAANEGAIVGFRDIDLPRDKAPSASAELLDADGNVTRPVRVISSDP